MWSIVNSMGHPAHNTGPFTTQKRQFSLNRGLNVEVPIVQGKTFRNPNFVIKEHPSIHSYQNNFISPFEKSHPDSSNTDTYSHNGNSALINSSQSLVDTLKEHKLDVVKNPEPKPEEQPKPSEMCSKKRSRRNHRNRRRRTANKNCKQNETKNYMRDMMDLEGDIETSLSFSDISVSPKMPSKTFNLTDFIVNKPHKISKATIEERDEYDSDGEEFVATIISVTPSTMCLRERQLSITESEDSFIVFGAGSDEELESSDESDTESEEEYETEEDEEGEDVVDFISPVVPTKKVRFADDSYLCEVHPMVKWSFAYQQARKGPWEEYARDRDRFNRRASDLEKILTPVFDVAHRNRVYRDRFKD